MTSGEHTKGCTELRWQDAADQICETMHDRMKDHARVAAEVIYADVMTATQDYLRENVVYNLHSELSSLQFRLDKLHKEAAERESAVAELVEALDGALKYLRGTNPLNMSNGHRNVDLREQIDSALTRFREAQAGGGV